MMLVGYTVQLEALADTAHPEAGIQAVTVIADVATIDGPDLVTCASCQEWMSRRPRHHGHPAFTAAAAVTEDAWWPKATGWQAKDLTTQWCSTRADRIVDAYDVARGWTDFPARTGSPHMLKHFPDPPGGGHDAPDCGGGQYLDHRPPVKVLTTEALPDADTALTELRDALVAADQARARAIEALRAEHAAGVSANELARKTDGLMSRPTVLAALASPEPPPDTRGRNRLPV